MARSIDKGTEEWQMWQDIFVFRKKYLNPPAEHDGKWWKEFTDESIALGEKYGTRLAKKIITEIVIEVNDYDRKVVV